MFTAMAAFGGFSVDDLDKAKSFYHDILGLDVQDQMGGARLKLPQGAEAWVYPKPDHQPASYTTLNFLVDDIDAAYDELSGHGVEFLHYDDMWQDAKGITRGKENNKGPNIAWFKDPAGNILAILEV